MERTVKYLEDADMVLVRTSGIYNMGKEEATLRRAREVLAINNCTKIIIDHRDATLLIHPEVACQRAALFDELGFSRNVKFAVIFKEVCGNMRFYEEINVRKGLKMKVCCNPDKAILWLTGSENECADCLLRCAPKAGESMG